MLKKVPVDRLRPGMYVHKLEGSWMNHPFWRSAFLLDEGTLRQLRQSAVREVWIDTDKGLDVATTAGAEGPARTLGEPEASMTAADSPPGMTGGAASARPAGPIASLQDELVQATRIVQQARGAMHDLFQDVRLGKAIDAEHCLPLVDDITQSVSRHPGAFVSLVRLKTSDDYTYMHSVAVCALMVSLARQLGLNDDDTREAGLAGLVHDLGKAAMPLEVLNKPGKLTDAEYAVMKAHPAEGHRMLVEARGVGPVPLDVCLHHHEKVNGTGYPKGLKGDEISLFAKMGAVCDVYDAITSNRPYKAGWDPAESLQKMAQWAKEGHFDERVFQGFVKSIGIYPVGSLVKLRSGRLAVVVDQGEDSLLQPVVKVFFSTKSNERIVPERLLLGTRSCKDEIVSRESPDDWQLGRLDELWMS
jgi:HD-GYP domain-containing protein (c-di-GMP phosphodiesterase class II)